VSSTVILLAVKTPQDRELQAGEGRDGSSEEPLLPLAMHRGEQRTEGAPRSELDIRAIASYLLHSGVTPVSLFLASMRRECDLLQRTSEAQINQEQGLVILLFVPE